MRASAGYKNPSLEWILGVFTALRYAFKWRSGPKCGRSLHFGTPHGGADKFGAQRLPYSHGTAVCACAHPVATRAP